MIRHRPPGTLLPPFPSTPLQILAVTLIQTHREGMTKRPHLLLPSPGFPHFSHSRLTTPLLPYHVFLFSWSYIFSVDDNVSSSPTFLLFPLSFFFSSLRFLCHPLPHCTLTRSLYLAKFSSYTATFRFFLFYRLLPHLSHFFLVYVSSPAYMSHHSLPHSYFFTHLSLLLKLHLPPSAPNSITHSSILPSSHLPFLPSTFSTRTELIPHPLSHFLSSAQENTTWVCMLASDDHLKKTT